MLKRAREQARKVNFMEGKELIGLVKSVNRRARNVFGSIAVTRRAERRPVVRMFPVA